MNLRLVLDENFVGLDARNLASCCCQRIGEAIATRLAAFLSLFPKVFKNLAQKTVNSFSIVAKTAFHRKYQMQDRKLTLILAKSVEK
jgi:hypothetical protein